MTPKTKKFLWAVILTLAMPLIAVGALARFVVKALRAGWDGFQDFIDSIDG